MTRTQLVHARQLSRFGATHGARVGDDGDWSFFTTLAVPALITGGLAFVFTGSWAVGAAASIAGVFFGLLGGMMTGMAPGSDPMVGIVVGNVLAFGAAVYMGEKAILHPRRTAPSALDFLPW